jgi:hypothetical protein
MKLHIMGAQATVEPGLSHRNLHKIFAMNALLRKLAPKSVVFALSPHPHADTIAGFLNSSWADVPLLIWGFIMLFPIFLGLAIHVARLKKFKLKWGAIEIETSTT